ncbi:MAG: phage tail sheath family protein [Luteimonas sp.]
MSPSFTAPGVYVEEIPHGPRTIVGVATGITAFVGRAAYGVMEADSDVPVTICAFADFEQRYGELDPAYPMGYAVRDFFINGGSQAVIVRLGNSTDGALLDDADYIGSVDEGTGLHSLRKVDLFNLLCIPPDTREGDTSPAVYRAALALCVECRAMLIMDAPAQWRDVASIVRDDNAALTALGVEGVAARNAALYFPRLLQADPASRGQLASFAACGAVAGVMARTDATRGVWKAPAGAGATLNGVQDVALHLTDAENGLLNPIAVNCLRTFPNRAPVVWGARTLAGGDASADDYTYVPVRRLALHIEESLLRGMQWAVFEPNDEPLWAQVRASVDVFMQGLFRQGAFHGTVPRDAYFVRCDASTTTPNDIDLGVFNISVGFAPLKPAEFVVIRLRQRAGSCDGS